MQVSVRRDKRHKPVICPLDDRGGCQFSVTHDGLPSTGTKVKSLGAVLGAASTHIFTLNKTLTGVKLLYLYMDNNFALQPKIFDVHYTNVSTQNLNNSEKSAPKKSDKCASKNSEKSTSKIPTIENLTKLHIHGARC